MHYKTIVLELLQEQYPILHELLRQERTLPISLDEYASQLKTAHLAWIDELRRASPETSPRQTSGEALELAIEHLRGLLPCESAADEPESLTLDGAMAFITRHTSPA
ncbi:MAG: hypothetical protein KGM43_06995 [Planctomycetota bacterium]|nr:hypothetical protein [Planctomycetota bacterium]